MSPGPRQVRWVRSVLAVLALAVPRALRDRWLKEWQGELGHWRGTLAAMLLSAARDTVSIRALQSSAAPSGALGPTPPLHEGTVTRNTLEDLRFAYLTLRKAPWTSLATVVTLALGIGASLAMFGVLRVAFLEPLPFSEADRLVLGRATIQGQLNPWASGADYYDYRDQAGAFEQLAAVLPFPAEVTVTGGQEAERAVVGVASTNLFSTLGVRPVLGRGFVDGDGVEGAASVVVIDHRLWRRRFGGDPKAVGRTLILDGEPNTVVGILPAGFFFMTQADMWVPMRPHRWGAGDRDRHSWFIVGRLSPRVTLDQAQVEVDLISARLEQAYPDTNRDKGLRLTPLQDALVEDYLTTLWALSGAVVLVLLIACGNGAGIFLARAPARRFDLAVRSALGASRARLARQLLVESLGLALASGVLGAVLASVLQRLMFDYLRMERLGPQAPHLTWGGVAVTLGLSLTAGLLAGAYPAWRGTRASAHRSLKAGERRMGDGGSGFRSTLVVAQVALSVLLLAASGLLIRSLANLQALDPGFASGNVLTARIWIPTATYPRAEDRIRFYGTLLEEVRALPGVASAAVTSHIPIGNPGNVYRATAVGEGQDPERIFLRSALPGYFETLGIPLLAGRDIQSCDGADSPPVVVLSETAARRFFGDENPLGKQVDLQLTQARRLEVVGVVGDVRLSRLEEEPEAALYVPFTQRAGNVMSVALKTRMPPGSLAAPLREVLRKLDPDVPLADLATVPELVQRSMADRRILTLAMTLLALFPLFLASVGLFATLTYHVSRRRHEIGVRMALGADAGRIGGMVLGQGMALVGVGSALGVAGALAATRILRSQLFGVGAIDPLTLVSVVGFVVLVALAASATPTWRAIRSDPKVALQAE